MAPTVASEARSAPSNAWQVEWGGQALPEELRSTPAGQPSVRELVAIGSVVRTNYGTGPYRVTCITEYALYGRAAFSLACEDLKGRGDYHLNELVAVDGRLLKLFLANTDEVFIEDPAGQLALI